jgi:hypothetical protein
MQLIGLWGLDHAEDTEIRVHRLDRIEHSDIPILLAVRSDDVGVHAERGLSRL